MTNLLLFPSPTLHEAPPDASERNRALDITQSFLVEAPAGSGKTALLLQRLLKLLAHPTVDAPAQVLAITFTRKATAELRDRVFAQLHAAHLDTPPRNAFDRATRPLAQAVLARDRQLGWSLLDHPHRLNIRTIDSVCGDIARSLPILSGSGGGQTPLDDAAPLHAEAARRTLMLLGSGDPALNSALELVLLHRDGNLADCESLVASMLASRDQWAGLIPLATPHLDDALLDTVVLPKLNKALDQAICRALTQLTRLLPLPLLERLCVLADKMAEAEGYRGAPSPIAICRGRNRPPREKAEDIEHWRALIHILVKPSKPRDWRKSFSPNHVGFEVLKHHQKELKEIIPHLSETPGLCELLCQIETLPPTRYPADQWLVTKAVFRTLSRALIELQIVFAERNQCDFTEVALLARTALRRDTALEDLGAALGTHLQHLLVDEMQDTSSSQYELLELLTQRWDGHSQTVFLVGDPKQSIYLFRQARVERFVRTMHLGRLGNLPDALPLTILQLSANFRSQAKLVHAFNQIFSLVFPPQPQAPQPQAPQPQAQSQPQAPQPEAQSLPDHLPYHPAQPVRAPTSAEIVWHLTALPYSAIPAECTAYARAQAVEDAAEIRRIVQRWQARPLPPGRPDPWKIAVLVRTRTHLLDIVRALRGNLASPPIPFRAVDIEPLGERHEILDLLALTRALLHPADRTAWLALLRTPWCGLTLPDLHLLAGHDVHDLAQRTILDLIRERGDLLSPDGIARLQPLWTVLHAALQQRGRLSLARWVERTWHAFGAAAYATLDELANIDRFFGLLDELEEPGGLQLTRLDQRLKKLYAAASLHPGAVDLMTIHGAKGLEWDVVLIPALERIGQTSRDKLLGWLEIDPSNELADPNVAHGILAPIKGKGAANRQLNTWMRNLEATREKAELKRLFYVACTRAREELHLFAAPARKKDDSISPKADTLLAAAWPAAEPHFLNLSPAAPPAPPLEMPGAVRPIPVPPRVVFSLAAAAEPSPPPPRVILRIPTQALPPGTRDPAPIQAGPTPAPRFDRPQGSFTARAVGNTLHALLDLLASRTAAGTTLPALLADLPSWSPRIHALLRAAGTPALEIDRHAASILRALTRTLHSPEGQWILSPHPQAQSEASFTSWHTERSTIRLDRTFLAGPDPLTHAGTHLWIVDYKTSTHGEAGLETFLQNEREKYRSQLETYALQLTRSNTHPGPLRVALFYPLLARLLWWEPTSPPPAS